MRDLSKIVSQRCHKIPKDKLNLFLVKLQFCSDSNTVFTADYVFDGETHYDVIVNKYGDEYPFQLSQIEEFVEELNRPEEPPKTEQFKEIEEFKEIALKSLENLGSKEHVYKNLGHLSAIDAFCTEFKTHYEFLKEKWKK